MSNAQKSDYITAVQCLQRLPSISNNLRGAKTRFDDFQAVHVVLSEKVHLVVRTYLLVFRFMPNADRDLQGQFLPWHRRLLNMFEVALRDECGFRGALP